MADKPRDPRTELRRVFDAIAGSAFEMSDEEILAEARDEGLDPEAEAAKAREILLRRVRKERLSQARRDYEEASARILTSTSRGLPESPAEKRRLLDAFMTSRPEIRGLATAQFRELADLSDADVEGTLRKLAELGLLDEFMKGEE